MTSPSPPATPTPGLGRATLTISSWNALSRLTGFARVLAVGGALGATFLGNTYTSANLVSTLTFELLAAGLLSAPLVPAIVGLLDAGRPAEAERLGGALLGASLVALGALALGLALAGPAVMRVLTLGVGDPAVREAEVRLGAFLLWFLLPQLVLYGAGAVATAFLNARRRFAAASFAPVANNLVVVVTMGAFVAVAGEGRGLDLGLAPRLVLGLGTTAGVLAMVAVPVVALARAGVRLRPRLDLSHPALPAVARAGAWGALFLAGAQVLIAVTLVLANRVEGGVVAYQIAFTFFLLPFAVLAHPVLTALHPRLASAAHAGRWDAVHHDLAAGLARTLLLVVPAAAVLAALAGPALDLARLGALDPEAARLVARVLAAYAVGLGGYAAFQLLARAAVAVGDARLPAMVGLGVAAGGSALMVAGSAAADGSDRVVALGLAHSVAVTAGAVALAALLRRRLARPLGAAPAVARALAAAAVAVAAAHLAPRLVGGGGRLGAGVDLAVGGPVAVMAAVAALWALREPELAAAARALSGAGRRRGSEGGGRVEREEARA